MARRTADELEAERRLILAAQRDPARFAELYERYVDQIHGYILSITGNRELAEDVTAATFARAMEDLPRFEWRGVPYSAWLYRVASNMLIRQRRRGDWLPLAEQLRSDAPDPADLAATGDRDRALRRVVAQLPTDQRQAVLLRFGGQLRNREIAAVMGRSEGAVKLLTFRALTALRSQLGAPQPAERRGRGGATREETTDG